MQGNNNDSTVKGISSMDKMSEFVILRGSGKSSISYMAGLHKLYTSGKISRTDYCSMRAAALVLLFGIPEEDALKQIEKELSYQREEN